MSPKDVPERACSNCFSYSNGLCRQLKIKLPPDTNPISPVDELLRQLADYKNDLAGMAAEQLLRKCSTSWEVFRYLQDRVHDAWLPDSARQQVRQIIKRIQVQLNQRREFGWAYEPR